MRKIDAVFAGLALGGLFLLPIGFAFAASPIEMRQGHLFETELTAAEETHDAMPATAAGHAGAWFGPNGAYFNYWLSVFSEEPLTGAHFHCAPRGEDGPVVVHLENIAGTSTPNGEIGREYLDDDDIAGTGAGCADTIGYAIEDLEDLARAMLEGNIYTNIHTATYPAGAARGQMTTQFRFVRGDTSTRDLDSDRRPSRAEQRPGR